MRKILYMLLFSIAIMACKETKAGDKEKITNEETDVNSTQEVTVDQAANVTHVLQLIQGIWINVDDPRFSIVFDGSQVKNRHVGIDNETDIHFSIGDACKNGLHKEPFDMEDKYISISGDAQECYKIIQLDEQNLILIYIAEGNTLTFRRE